MSYTKHTTGEQPGMDKYSEGFIYMNYRTSGISHSFDKKVYVIGPHSFRDGEDVTGRYELVYQTNFGTSWDEAPKIVYDACIESGRRIVAIPLPSKGQEGEAEIIKGSDKDLAIEVVARFAAKSGGRNGRWKDQMKQQFIEGAIWMRERLTTPAP